jgi:hypothetical protein
MEHERVIQEARRPRGQLVQEHSESGRDQSPVAAGRWQGCGEEKMDS